MNWFRVGDCVRCIAPGPFGSPDEVGQTYTVVECTARGRIRLHRNGPPSHPDRFELLRPASGDGTPADRAADLISWFAANADAMPAAARTGCLRGMRAVMETAFGVTFRSDGPGRVVFEPLPSGL